MKPRHPIEGLDSQRTPAGTAHWDLLVAALLFGLSGLVLIAAVVASTR